MNTDIIISEERSTSSVEKQNTDNVEYSTTTKSNFRRKEQSEFPEIRKNPSYEYPKVSKEIGMIHEKPSLNYDVIVTNETLDKPLKESNESSQEQKLSSMMEKSLMYKAKLEEQQLKMKNKGIDEDKQEKSEIPPVNNSSLMVVVSNLRRDISDITMSDFDKRGGLKNSSKRLFKKNSLKTDKRFSYNPHELPKLSYEPALSRPNNHQDQDIDRSLFPLLEGDTMKPVREKIHDLTEENNILRKKNESIRKDLQSQNNQSHSKESKKSQKYVFNIGTCKLCIENNSKVSILNERVQTLEQEIICMKKNELKLLERISDLQSKHREKKEKSNRSNI